jgi:hypothetical protein
VGNTGALRMLWIVIGDADGSSSVSPLGDVGKDDFELIMEAEPIYRCTIEALTLEDNIGGVSTVGGFRGVKEDALDAGTEHRMRGDLGESFEAFLRHHMVSF